MGVLIGVDVGKSRDPTAVAVVETEERREAERIETHFLVRHLERLPLGTPYPKVVERVAAISGQARVKAGEVPAVYLDSTGVGQPVVDLLRDRLPGGWVVPVHFTHGDRRNEVREGRETRVALGKAHMVCQLQALLQNRRLHLPRSREAQALTAELQSYEIRVSDDAGDRYGAFKAGTHDDLVTALGLACQSEQSPRRLRSGAALRARGG